MTFIKNNLRHLIYFVTIIFVILKIALWNNSYYKELHSIEVGKKVAFECTVDSVPQENNSTTSFDAKPEDKEISKFLIHVNVECGDRLNLCYGDKLQITATIQKPQGKMNYGNFSYSDYLRSSGVCMIANAKVFDVKILKKSTLGGLYNLRRKITINLFNLLPPDEASVVNALVTGDKSMMPEHLSETFRRAGVYHIVAVSGLHLNAFILLLSYSYLHLKIKQKYKKLLTLASCAAGSIFVLIFTGFGVSVQRAAIMACLLCLAVFAHRKYHPFSALVLSAIVILVKSPFLYADLSFRLSFMATLGIIVAIPAAERFASKFKHTFVVSSAIISTYAWLFTLPTLVRSFGKISTVSVLANLVIPPLVPLALALSYATALCSVVLPFAGQIVAYVCINPIEAIIKFSQIFAKIPYSYINMNLVQMFAMIFVVVSILTIIYTMAKAPRSKWLALSLGVFTAINILLFANNILPHKMHVDFINVGQGDCSVISSPKGVCIMTDLGSENVTDVANDCVIPYLNYCGVSHIDALMVSHFHNDHANGICTFLENFNVKMLILPRVMESDDEYELKTDIIQKAIRMHIPIYFASANDKITIDKYSYIDILNPTQNINLDANNHSLVAKLNCYGKSVLFTGDIQDVAMFRIKQNNIKSDIVKVPHHGGYALQAKDFATKCNPKYAVVSCGINNKYHHPNPMTFTAYKNSQIFRTDENKTVRFVIDQKEILADCMAR